MRNDRIPEWLLKETFAVQHNPNCPNPFLVRLIGHNKGMLDLLAYAPRETKDAIGFGKSLAEAAHRAALDRIEQESTHEQE